MDYVKEVKEFIQSIKTALTDGRITVGEAVAILREFLDVVLLFVDAVGVATFKAMPKQENQQCQESDGLW